ncbi:MAG TPA: hypothetical protein VFE73_18515 [Reyranella sp.]|jgi:hypothetical protein|nr:hypothetical protein [Reyranella sp.]
MMTLLGSYEFLFGALMLCAFQIHKFGEVDDDLRDEVALPNLRASDFLSHVSYVAVLTLFVAVTLVGFAVLCWVAPAMIGWIQVTAGTGEAAAIDKIAPSSYPLWIAAAFMGLAHQGIPGLKNVANIQRKFFHALIGVPRYVLDTSSCFSRQMLVQAANNRKALAQRLAELCGDKWQVTIEPFADTWFFQSELKRLKLDSGDNLREALGASPRELRTWLQQVVYVACIATMRKSGPHGLAGLAEALRVEQKGESRPLADLMLPALGSTAVVVVLLFLVPMVGGPVAWLVGAPVEQMFWPHEEGVQPGQDGPIMQSLLYLLGQVVPLLIAAAILASHPLPRAGTKRRRADSLLVENAGTYFAIGAAVFAYCCALTLWDYGRHSFYDFHGLLPFLQDQAPYFLLQSMIAVAVCIVIQRRSAENLTARRDLRMFDGLMVVGVAVVTSAFYAAARLKYGFLPPRTADFVLLVVILNAMAAAIAFVGCQSVWRRRLAREELREAFPMPVPTPAAASPLPSGPEPDLATAAD